MRPEDVYSYRHAGPEKPLAVFFSLLYRCQNSLNKGKQITPQIGMFTVQVASGQHRPEQNIYIHVSTQGIFQHKSSYHHLKKVAVCMQGQRQN